MRTHLLAFALLCLASPTLAEGEADCANPTSQVDMTVCADEATGAAEDKMATAYETAHSGALAFDQAGSAGEDSLAKSVEAAQAAWEAYRDAECHVGFVRAGGGQGADLEQLGCRSILAEARAKELGELADYLLAIR